MPYFISLILQSVLFLQYLFSLFTSSILIIFVLYQIVERHVSFLEEIGEFADREQKWVSIFFLNIISLSLQDRLLKFGEVRRLSRIGTLCKGKIEGSKLS